MTPTSWTELKDQHLEHMSADERIRYDRTYAEAALAANVGQRIHVACEAEGISQRELARRMCTSPAVDRLESRGVAATLTTLQLVATALDLEGNVELRPSA